MREGATSVETLGVVSEPILDFDPSDVVLAFVHIFMGVFNRIYVKIKEQLQELFDLPFIARSDTVVVMEAKIVELEEKQLEQRAMITALKESG